MKMKRLQQKHIVALFIAAFVLVILGCIAAVAMNGIQGSGTGGGVDVEDCDKEDRAKREYAECGYIPPVKTTKPAPAQSPVKPAPRTTRK